ncbi:MAG: carboxypeptidase-like regulatory domain-containing protein [Bryobacterales bacterium]|nr:carboxypeptidase-like regulatory domain-containing protein [Bryobacterales bacterium]
MKRRIGLVSLLLCLLASNLLAQSNTSLRGTVTDMTGAVIPGATLTLTNTATQATRTTNASEDGTYVFAQVSPALYQLKASAAGFNDILINDLRLLVNQPVTQNVTFEKIGTVAETISVSADAVQLNTTDASLGNAVGTKPVIELPFNARNVVGLLSLQPGVLYIKEDEDMATNDSRSGNVNGARNDQSNITLDGVDVNDQMNRNPFSSVLRVTLDSVQEFRTVTLNAQADQGRSSGAQVSMVTKSGTNEVHGSAYWFHRNNATSANDFFLKTSQLTEGSENKPPKLIRNIGGASLGGPLVKNRWFLFGNWEHRRDASENIVLRFVPTNELKQGIVRYPDVSGNLVTVGPQQLASSLDPRGVNPASLAVLQQYPDANTFAVGDGINIAGYRFVSPISLRWNTYIAKTDLKIDAEGNHNLFVRGNLQNDNEGGVSQFPGQAPNLTSLRNSKGLAVGLTSVMSTNIINDFRYGLTRQGFEDAGIATTPLVTFRNIDSYVGTNRNFRALIPVHTIANTTTWTTGKHTVSFGFQLRGVRNDRLTNQNSFSSASANASWLVESGAGLNQPFTDMDPTFRVSFRDAAAAVLGIVTQGNAQYNYLTDGTVLPQGAPVQRNFNNNEYEFFVSDSWRIKPNLTITAGLRWSLMPPVEEENGQQLSSDIPLSSWFGLRGFLASEGRSQAEVPKISFVNNEDPRWRPLYPYHKKNFAPRLGIAWSPSFNDGIGKFLFGGAGKTSIRAGWGMFYDNFGQGILRRFDATAFGLSNALTNPSATTEIRTAPRFTGITEIPQSILPPAPPAAFPATFPDIFAITNSIDDSLVPPYSMTMNFNVGRDFGKGIFIQAGYVGRLGRRLMSQTDLATPTNLRDPASGQTYFQAATQAANIVNGAAFSDLASASGSAAAARAVTTRIPFFEAFYPQYSTSGLNPTQSVLTRFWANSPDYTFALFNLDSPDSCSILNRNRCTRFGPNALFNSQYSFLSSWRNMGSSDYHSFQLNTRKQWNNGDLIDFNYTWSKSIDLSSEGERVGTTTGVITNPWEPSLFRAVSDFDTTHQFAASAVYNLPFGTGRRFMTNANGFLNAVFGGWQISTVWRATSGFPIGAGNGRFWPTNWNLTGLARVVGDIPTTGGFNNAPSAIETAASTGGPNIFSDPKAGLAAFDYELPGGIGARNIMRGEGVFQLDTNLAKSFTMPYNENHRLQFRWEAYNIMNTVRFDVYDISMDLGNASTFGNYQSTLTSPRIMQFGLRYDF